MEESQPSHFLSKQLTQTLGAYVEGKYKQWDVELKDVHQTFSKSIQRLSALVQRFVKKYKKANNSVNKKSVKGSASNSNRQLEQQDKDACVDRVLYIVSFLCKAMKRSYSTGGMGTEMMWDIFKGKCKGPFEKKHPSSYLSV